MTTTPSDPAERNGAAQGAQGGVEAAPLDARELLAIFWRRRWLILPVMVAVLGLFAVWSVTKAPEYRALARVQVMREEPAVPSLAADAGVAGLPSDPVASEIQVLRSRSLLYSVADSLVLQLSVQPGPWRRDELFPDLALAGPVVPGAYTLAFTAEGVAIRDEEERTVAAGAPGDTVTVAGLRFALPAPPKGEPAEIGFQVRDRRAAGEALYEAFSTNIVQRTNLVDLSLRHHDPVLAADVLNAIIQLGRRQSVARLRERASARRRFIERQLAGFETQLRQAQADVQAYQEEIGAVSLESEQSGQIANILAFERQVEELRLERQLYQPILDGLDRKGADQAGAEQEGAEQEGAEQEAADREGADQQGADQEGADRQGADQAASFEALAATPALVKNPAIADLYRRMVALEVKRDSLLSGPVGAGAANPAVRAVDDQIRTAAAKLTDALREYLAGIDRQIEEQRRTIARLQRASEGRLPHAAELARREQKVESLLKVYEALQTQLEQTRIEEASESGRLAIIDPATVPRQPVNATGLSDIILALMLAGMLGFGGALLVDHFDDRLRSPREVRRNLGFTVLGAVPRFDSPDGRGMSQEQGRVHLEPLSAPAEAYRIIRTNLSFVHAVKPRRTLLVTSPGPGAGKTTTAINLAAVLRQQGQRTLLIDADLRKSSVHRLLGVPGEVGLTSVLTGRASPKDAIVPAGIDGLEVLPAGPKPPNPAELLGAEAMAKLLAAVAQRYDRVVVDSPPVLAVADPATLVRRLDGVVMVARAGKTARQALVEAMQVVHGVGGEVLGVVVNALKPERLSGGYYYRYYRDGYYGDGKRAGRRVRRFVTSTAGILFFLALGAAIVGFGLWRVLEKQAPKGEFVGIRASAGDEFAGSSPAAAAGTVGGGRSAVGGESVGGRRLAVGGGSESGEAPVADRQELQGAADRQLAPAQGQPGSASAPRATADAQPVTADAQRATADTEPATAEGQAPTAAGQSPTAKRPPVVPLPYAVAVASYGSSEDALEQVRAVARAGIAPVYVVPVRVGEILSYRVYTGALASRANAEALLGRLIQAGLKDDSTAWDIRPAGYAFDFGMFESEARARDVIDLLFEEEGLVGYALPVPAPDGEDGWHYRLYVGGYESAAQAAELGQLLESRGLMATLATRTGVPVGDRRGRPPR